MWVLRLTHEQMTLVMQAIRNQTRRACIEPARTDPETLDRLVKLNDLIGEGVRVLHGDNCEVDAASYDR